MGRVIPISPGVAALGADHQPTDRARRRDKAAALVGTAHIGPTLAVTAIVAGLSGATTSWPRALWASSAVLCGQLSVGWSNDAVDVARDRAAGRLDKPLAVGRIERATVWRCAALAVLMSTVLSLGLGWKPGTVHLVAVAMGWAYNVRLKDSPLSPLPYGIAFGALPAFLTLSATGSWPPVWTMLAAALLGSGAHFFNVLPDLIVDRRSGLRGLPQRCGAGQIVAVGAGLLGAAVALVAVFAPRPHGWTGAMGAVLLAAAAACVAATVASAAVGALRRAWALSIATAVLVSASLVASGAAALA